LFAGIGDQMKIIVIATGALWPILLNTVEGVRAADPVLSTPPVRTASAGCAGSGT
jgi:ABC-type nitrate/sulfonate/bicarbonate transport system permease component